MAQALRIVADFHSANAVPGVSVAVFDSTRILFGRSMGVRAADRPAEAMTEDTVFRLYSLTKMITALAIMRLADGGRLLLDDLVASFFPSSTSAPALVQEITIRQLLSHTSGLARGEINLDYGSRDPAGLAQYLLGEGINGDFVADPGDLYSYSDVGFGFLGYVIERITGRPFTAAIKELVFEPLGMDHACFDPLVAMTMSLSQQHIRLPSQGVRAMRRFVESARMYPYSGAFCSTRDMCRLGMLHLGQGMLPDSTDQIISAAAIREMRDPVSSIGLDIGLGYGLGAYVGPLYGKGMSYGHEGYHLGTWCKLVLCPCPGIGLIWCDNCGQSDDLTSARLRSISELLAVFGAGEPSWEAAGALAGLDGDNVQPENAEIAGCYRRLAAGALRVYESAGELRIADNGCDVPLHRYRNSVFATPEQTPLPVQLPWKPHAGSDRCCAFFVRGRDKSVSYLSINGVVYRRQR
jgi:CubicO group peptidase (beta-lactamase class C family)